MMPPFDPERIRPDFPILATEVNRKPLVYLDNAATTHKPKLVTEAVSRFYLEDYSNIHRGVHTLSNRATDLYEAARRAVARFLNAPSPGEIIFTAGTTASINLVAFSFAEQFIHAGDEILVTEMEHHSNIVPWQMAATRRKAHLRVLPFDDSGILLMDRLDELLTDRTRIVAITHVSNSLGTVNPIAGVIQAAHRKGIPVLVDGAQSVQHLPIDVQALDCDFFVFSGHKIFAPTGIGVLYGKKNWLDQMPPYQGGGDMIETVTFEKTVYNQLPFKFEAGTSHFVGAHGLATALGYLESLGMESLQAWEESLLAYATEALLHIPGVRIIGTAAQKAGVISFLPGEIHPFDAGMILDKMGIAVRTGTHCTQPVMDHFGIHGTVRASLAFYNTREDVDRLAEGLRNLMRMFE